MSDAANITKGGRVWVHVHWPRPLSQDLVVGLLRSWAADQPSPVLVLDTRASSAGVRYLLELPNGARHGIYEALGRFVPGTAVSAGEPAREPVTLAGWLRASTHHRPLRTTDVEMVSRAVLGD